MGKIVRVSEVEAVQYECGECGKIFTGGVMEFIEGVTPKCDCDGPGGDDYVTVIGFILKTPPEVPQEVAEAAEQEKPNWLDILEAAQDAARESYKISCGIGDMQSARDMNTVVGYLGVSIDLWRIVLNRASEAIQVKEDML